jgi:hypothetical protein
MDISAIGAWAGSYGPFVVVIALLLRQNWRLEAQFFDQQKLLMDMLRTTAHATELAERVVQVQAQSPTQGELR